MTANTPPKPHAEGDKFTNTETGITYEFKSGAWRAVSSEAADAVVDAISELDLEKVLAAGNVATQGATFGGKVIVEPGTTGNEAVTYQQLQDNSSAGDYLPLSGGTLEGDLTVNGTGDSGTAPFIVRKDGYYTSFAVDRSGNVSAGASESAYFVASKDNHVITKGVVNRDIATPAHYSWKRQNKSSSPSSGHFTIKDGRFLQVSSVTYNGHKLRYDSGLSTAATKFPGTGYMSGINFLTGQVNFWKRTTGNSKDWTLMGIGGAYKYRLNYGGFVEVEFLDFRGNWTNLTYEDEFFINVNGLF